LEIDPGANPRESKQPTPRSRTKRDRFEIDLPRLDLGQVENIVDDRRGPGQRPGVQADVDSSRFASARLAVGRPDPPKPAVSRAAPQGR
jgi:hypothetical protein